MPVKIFISVLAFVFCTLVHAQNVPAGFDQAKFQALVDIAVQKGQPYATDFGDYRSLVHVLPADTSKPRKADYFSAVGAGEENTFSVNYLSVVSENWSQHENGDWEIEQWVWMIGADGSLVSLVHQLIVENASSTVTDIHGLPAGPVTDPAELERVSAKLNEWYGFN